MFNYEKKKYILNKYCKNNIDTGSIEIQIILFTFKMEKMYFHINKNFKDKNSILAFRNIFCKREKLIKYFIKKNKNYINLLNDLNIKE